MHEGKLSRCPSGDVFCWISNGKALLLVLGVPVALILVFNVAALSHTMVSIWKVQKVTLEVFYVPKVVL